MTIYPEVVPLRDAQEAASHADPRTTMRYDRARGSLDRHATYIVAAYVAGATRQRHTQLAQLRPTAAAAGRSCPYNLTVTHSDPRTNANRLIETSGRRCGAWPGWQ